MTTTRYYDNTGNRINRAAYLRLQALGVRGIHAIRIRRNQIILRIRQPQQENNAPHEPIEEQPENVVEDLQSTVQANRNIAFEEEYGFFAKLIHQIKLRRETILSTKNLRVSIELAKNTTIQTAQSIIKSFGIAVESHSILQSELQDYLTSKQFNKNYSFTEYTKRWGYKSSEIDELKNPFSLDKNTFGEVKKMRKYVMARGKYPRSGRIHTKRWKFYRKFLLPHLPFEQYTHVSLEELAGRSQASFNKKNKFQVQGWETYMASKLRKLPDRSCFGVDKNGKLLYLVIKQGITEEEQQEVLTALLNILAQFPGQKPNKRDARHKNDQDMNPAYRDKH